MILILDYVQWQFKSQNTRFRSHYLCSLHPIRCPRDRTYILSVSCPQSEELQYRTGAERSLQWDPE